MLLTAFISPMHKDVCFSVAVWERRSLSTWARLFSFNYGRATPACSPHIVILIELWERRLNWRETPQQKLVLAKKRQLTKNLCHPLVVKVATDLSPDFMDLMLA